MLTHKVKGCEGNAVNNKVSKDNTQKLHAEFMDKAMLRAKLEELFFEQI